MDFYQLFYLCLTIQITSTNGFTLPFSSFSSKAVPIPPKKNSNLTAVKTLPSVSTSRNTLNSKYDGNFCSNSDAFSSLLRVTDAESGLKALASLNCLPSAIDPKTPMSSLVEKKKSTAEENVVHIIPSILTSSLTSDLDASATGFLNCPYLTRSIVPSTTVIPAIPQFITDPSYVDAKLSCRTPSVTIPNSPLILTNYIPSDISQTKRKESPFVEVADKNLLPELLTKSLNINFGAVSSGVDTSNNFISSSPIIDTSSLKSVPNICLNNDRLYSKINSIAPDNNCPITNNHLPKAKDLVLDLPKAVTPNFPPQPNNIPVLNNFNNEFVLNAVNTYTATPNIDPTLSVSNTKPLSSCDSPTNSKLKVKSFDLKILPVPFLSFNVSNPLEGKVTPLKKNEILNQNLDTAFTSIPTTPTESLVPSPVVDETTEFKTVPTSSKPTTNFIKSTCLTTPTTDSIRPTVTCPETPAMKITLTSLNQNENILLTNPFKPHETSTQNNVNTRITPLNRLAYDVIPVLPDLVKVENVFTSVPLLSPSKVPSTNNGCPILPSPISDYPKLSYFPPNVSYPDKINQIPLNFETIHLKTSTSPNIHSTSNFMPNIPLLSSVNLPTQQSKANDLSSKITQSCLYQIPMATFDCQYALSNSFSLPPVATSNYALPPKDLKTLIQKPLSQITPMLESSFEKVNNVLPPISIPPPCLTTHSTSLFNPSLLETLTSHDLPLIKPNTPRLEVVETNPTNCNTNKATTALKTPHQVSISSTTNPFPSALDSRLLQNGLNLLLITAPILPKTSKNVPLVTTESVYTIANESSPNANNVLLNPLSNLVKPSLFASPQFSYVQETNELPVIQYLPKVKQSGLPILYLPLKELPSTEVRQNLKNEAPYAYFSTALNNVATNPVTNTNFLNPTLLKNLPSVPLVPAFNTLPAKDIPLATINDGKPILEPASYIDFPSSTKILPSSYALPSAMNTLSDQTSFYLNAPVLPSSATYPSLSSNTASIASLPKVTSVPKVKYLSSCSSSTKINSLASELTNTFLTSALPNLMSLKTKEPQIPLVALPDSKPTFSSRNSKRESRKTSSKSTSPVVSSMTTSSSDKSSVYSEVPENAPTSHDFSYSSTSLLENSLDSLTNDLKSWDLNSEVITMDTVFDDNIREERNELTAEKKPTYNVSSNNIKYMTYLESNDMATICHPESKTNDISPKLNSNDTQIVSNEAFQPSEADASILLPVRDFLGDTRTPEEIAQLIILKELLNIDENCNWDLMEKIINILCTD